MCAYLVGRTFDVYLALRSCPDYTSTSLPASALNSLPGPFPPDGPEPTCGQVGHRQLSWGRRRKSGQSSRSCRVCSNRLGPLGKCSLSMCRQCYRRHAEDTGCLRLD
ncbi:40S ribosomal protein S29-like [Prionailurus viverrinus]|uniref:40S ribosomal protein S29-like n=1 Tax=Prionailurus viverrinus TaxID=61388 RepID=UPI001FF0F4A9|nr:40S ribosomal protein S29-like [Prionailurus viverrinus]